MTILESNKRIARFMGYEYYPYVKSDTHPPASKGHHGWIKKGQQNHPGVYKLNGLYLCRTSKDLPYRNDWNYLTPVVQKLILIPEEGYVFMRSIEGLYPNLGAVYERVVSFIEDLEYDSKGD